MSTTNNMQQVIGRPSGPPGPPVARVKAPSQWNTLGWSIDHANSSPTGWREGPEQIKHNLGGWSESQCLNSNTRRHINSGWDEHNQEVEDGWGRGNMNLKPVEQKKMISLETVRNSKQYRILCNIGYQKGDAEYALRITGGIMEDAIELLNTNGCIRDQASIFEGDSSNFFDQPRHFPVMPGSSRQTLYSHDGSHLSNYKMPNNQQPHQPQQIQEPSSQQLCILVQQIKMAVQAGHLNSQILNQPLAPQTLISLNHLLQQVKTLQSLQQQHLMAQSQMPMGGNISSLHALSVNISKTKQNIQNLKNQISAQQTAYQKSQLMQAPHQQFGGSSSFDYGMPDIFGNSREGYNSGKSTAHTSHLEPHLPVIKSRLNLWKLPEEECAFSKASIASPSGPSNLSGNTSGFGFDNNPWTPSCSNSGWPDAKKSLSGVSFGDSVCNSLDSGLDSFGIPEFEPGKPWKEPGVENHDDDPNLTLSNLAPGPLDRNDTNLQSLSTENLLGLTSTWTYGSSGSELNPTSSKADAWNQPSLAITTSSSILSLMGNDLTSKSSTACTPSSKSNNDRESGNATIHATFTSDSDAAAILQQFGGGNYCGKGPQLDVTSTLSLGDSSNSPNLTSQPMGGSSTGSDIWGGLGTGVEDLSSAVELESGLCQDGLSAESNSTNLTKHNIFDDR